MQISRLVQQLCTCRNFLGKHPATMATNLATHLINISSTKVSCILKFWFLDPKTIGTDCIWGQCAAFVRSCLFGPCKHEFLLISFRKAIKMGGGCLQFGGGFHLGEPESACICFLFRGQLGKFNNRPNCLKTIHTSGA